MAQRTQTRLTDAQEQRLVEAIRAGRTDAWAELLESYQDRLYTICCRMVGDRELAADLTHDALVRVIEGLDSYDGRAKLSTWIIRVTMNVCLSKLRSEKHRRHASLDAMGEGGSGGDWPARHAGEGEPAMVSGVQLREQHQFLSQALARIEPDHRAVLILRDVQGLDYERIAVALELRLGTVKSRLFRARAALRRAFEEEAGSAEPTARTDR
ncbi:MAG: sigma-70 family RNA polymerase sigma factor [Planctomycetes bacterium]|nr:sigma-70 family RNA polymerase sigma factor [Planctomycetota bacterium]